MSEAAASSSTKTSHSVDLDAFARQFTGIPAIIGCVFSFLSLHLMAQLPKRLWRHVGARVTRLFINTCNGAERRFWCGLSFDAAFSFGRLLTQIECIVIRFPSGSYVRIRIPPSSCGRTSSGPSIRYSRILIRRGADIVTALVEGHCDRQRGQAARSTLESIEFSTSQLRLSLDDDEYDQAESVWQHAALAPPLDTPPTLHSLTSISGFGEHDFMPASFYRQDRHWQLPSLQRLQTLADRPSDRDGQPCWGVPRLLLRACRSLREVDMAMPPGHVAEALAEIPIAQDGQPGPLSQLQDIGPLICMHHHPVDVITAGYNAGCTIIPPDEWAAGVGRLQGVLVARGCRSIKSVTVDLGWHEPVDSSMFEALSAIEAFTRTVYDRLLFDLSLLCDVPVHPVASPFVRRHLLQMAADVSKVSFLIQPQHVTAPLDTPTPAAKALAQAMRFPKATSVKVIDFPDMEELEADTPPPDPLVIDELPDAAFPTASRLTIGRSLGSVIERKLVTKMPVLAKIEIGGSWELVETSEGVPEADAVRVLEAVGADRHLDLFRVDDSCFVTGVGEGGVTWGERTDELPSMEKLELSVEVPEHLADSDAAGEFGITCVRSLLKIRGLKELALEPRPWSAFARLVQERRHGDSIEGVPGRFVIGWSTAQLAELFAV
ncbi:unnamed protein product [Vitrella brassicaformis CCMP3155]|uniref:Uncharacterized protein n=1 Tax=Vitrella brassicaformis (strain CCMP3155) TaxID=1169540 RepID=A0A0G4FFM6_VITBC|nr:unnamed protein product [Vitrella brassicaformis CCMP3155]|eukprot:CEM11842.1 unnamed protein product [Vitrella brassicaformis CCMP3155]